MAAPNPHLHFITSRSIVGVPAIVHVLHPHGGGNSFGPGVTNDAIRYTRGEHTFSSTCTARMLETSYLKYSSPIHR